MIDSDPAVSARDEQRERIVAVAARLLHEQGAAALTTRGVADAAEVQAPAIYRLFGDKDGLIEAVAEQVMAAHVAEKAANAGAGDDPLHALRWSWRLQIDFGLANPELLGLLTGPGRARTSPAIQAGIEVLRSRVRALAEAGLLRVSEQRAVQMIHAAGTGTVQALLEVRADERDPGLSDAMLEAVLNRILRLDASAPSAGHSVAVAVTFAAQIPQLPALTDAERMLLAEWLDRSIAAAQD